MANRSKIMLFTLNLTAAISCLVIGLNILMYGSIMIVEPNPVIVAVEVVLAIVTILLNVREVRSHK